MDTLSNVDDHLSLAKASRLIPGRPSATTVWRWTSKGVKVRGHRVLLGCQRVGGRVMTTPRQIHSFFAALNAAHQAPAAPDVAHQAALERERQVQAALVDLKSMGFKVE